MLKTYRFTEAMPLMAFLEEHRTQWQGQRLLGYYCDVPMAHYSKSPMVFAFEAFTVAVEYPLHSDITLHVMDRACGALFPGMWALSETECSCVGQRLASIKLSRRNCRCMAKDGSQRPYGGDYFTCIELHMEQGGTVTVNSSDYRYGDYGRAFTDACRDAGRFFPPMSRHARLMQAVERDFGEGFVFSEESGSAEEADLQRFTAGTGEEKDAFRGCHVLSFTGGAYKKVVRLYRKIPTFDSADREYDSWHKLYLIQKADGSIFPVYATGGYKVASVEGFAGVLAMPEELQAYFD